MKEKVKTIKLKVNKPLLNYKIGGIVTLAVDRNGRVVSKYWASRIIDAKIDGCVEIMSDKKETSLKQSSSTVKKQVGKL